MIEIKKIAYHDLYYTEIDDQLYNLVKNQFNHFEVIRRNKVRYVYIHGEYNLLHLCTSLSYRNKEFSHEVQAENVFVIKIERYPSGYHLRLWHKDPIYLSQIGGLIFERLISNGETINGIQFNVGSFNKVLSAIRGERGEIQYVEVKK